MSQVAEGQVKEVAERIGMAARSLPGCEISFLVERLLNHLGSPLTAEKLNQMSVATLQAVIGDIRDAPQKDELKQAARYLRGEGLADDVLPDVQPYVDGDMPKSIRLAVASNTAENLDGHFGSAKRFLIYQVSPLEVRLIDIRDPSACDDAEDPNVARAQLIADCQLLFVQSIGGPAAAKVVRANIHPVKHPQGGEATTVINRLQQSLQAPPPWLARVMGVNNHLSERFAATEE